jgi:hypothetical protein
MMALSRSPETTAFSVGNYFSNKFAEKPVQLFRQV